MEGESTPPMPHQYQEQKELWGGQKFDTLIVLGRGPVKPVLLADELSPEQQEKWKSFSADPLHQPEPDFRVIEGSAYTSQLKRIDETDLPDPEKQAQKETIRQQWQESGRLALNRWSRQNALASGLALYLGITDRLVLAGGHSKPRWAKEKLPEERLTNLPSEAELMKDVIVRRFGDLYKSKFGKPIESAISTEAESVNTLENFALTINNQPEIVDQKKRIGVIAAEAHLRRAVGLAQLFSVDVAARGKLAAQDILRERADIRGKSGYSAMLKFMTDQLRNPELRRQFKSEEMIESGLITEKFLAYWIGYLVDIQNPVIIQKVLGALSDPAWAEHARSLFTELGLDFDTFSTAEKLNDAQLKELREKLGALKRGSDIRERTWQEMKREPRGSM